MTKTDYRDQVVLAEKPTVKAALAKSYKSPLHEMTQTTQTCLWNDSASIQELSYSIEHGAVGATCNPVIVVGVLKKEMSSWKDRIRSLIDEMPAATEDQIGWQLVRLGQRRTPAGAYLRCA